MLLPTLTICQPAPASGRGPAGYVVAEALQFVPRGYDCEKPCRCLEFYLPEGYGEAGRRDLARVRLALRGFAAPEGETQTEACDPANAIAVCEAAAGTLLPEKGEPPDVVLVWYDTAEIGIEEARANCTPEGFTEL